MSDNFPQLSFLVDLYHDAPVAELENVRSRMAVCPDAAKGLLPFMDRLRMCIADGRMMDAGRAIDGFIKPASGGEKTDETAAGGLWYLSRLIGNQDTARGLKHRSIHIRELRDAMGPLVDPGLREQLDRLVQRIIQMFSVTLDDYYGNEENIAVIRGIIDRIIQIDQSNRTGQGQLVPITTGRSSDQVADNGILITGLPGTGKTYLSDCISNEYGVKVYKVGPEEMLGLDKGRSSRQTRDVDQLIAKTNEITEQAAEHSKREVCMLFIDEFGKYAPDRTKPNITPDQETYVDYLLQRVEFLRKNYPNLIIFAATNKELEDLEPAMIREGRFDVLLKFAPPTVADIKQMFEKTLAAHVESGSLDDQRITAIAEKALGLMPQSVIKAVITALITASLEDREFTIDDLETSIGLKVAGRSIDISRNRPAVEAKAGE